MRKKIVISILIQVLELNGIINREASEFISILLDSYEEHLLNDEWTFFIKQYYNLIAIMVELIQYLDVLDSIDFIYF
ncbi:hypothetical protein HMPREF9711_03113 [Myroides odoratimimus CCUG 3837]|uniref:hypothetical protein n=1 Tax=Myroides odoratimimus TaxID=76832 RepID=UPI000280AC3F|nr:hypothetical protein [Myroides odoratimimus]EKB02651.1 hypothetical protein HMPREF9711_03113 [Myroides odoratimimus CCUG 3837]